MNKEEKENPVKGYWFEIAIKLSRISKSDNAKTLKKKLVTVIEFLDKIIELEVKND